MSLCLHKYAKNPPKPLDPINAPYTDKIDRGREEFFGEDAHSDIEDINHISH